MALAFLVAVPSAKSYNLALLLAEFSQVCCAALSLWISACCRLKLSFIAARPEEDSPATHVSSRSPLSASKVRV